jgi:hypothetical protein
MIVKMLPGVGLQYKEFGEWQKELEMDSCEVSSDDRTNKIRAGCGPT